MPFGLRNLKATYQGLVNSVFSEQIGENLGVYVDDMVSKTMEEGQHEEDLKETLAFVRKYNMRLNMGKCSFRMQVEKFLGIMLTN